MTDFTNFIRTDLRETSIVSAVDADGRSWTLVVDADGHDFVVTPNGAHVDCSFEPTAEIADFVDFVVSETVR